MTYLALKATDEEVRMVESLKRYMHQNSVSGVLRALVSDAYLKIFAQNLPNDRITTPSPSAPAVPAQGEGK